MDSTKTGLVLGGVILAAGAGVGIYFLSKKYKDVSVGRITDRLYFGDWNSKSMNAWKRQQAMLHAHRQGVPVPF